MMLTQEIFREWQTTFQTALTTGLAQVQSGLSQAEDRVKGLSDQIEDVRQHVVENKKEIAKVAKAVNKTEVRLEDVQSKVEEVETTQVEDGGRLIKVKMERAACMLRMQGLTEEKYEDLALIIITALAPELEMGKEELDRDIDSMYQMNLGFARRNKFPREVHMKFTQRILRDVILQAMQDKKIIMQGCEVKILKEVPWNVRQKKSRKVSTKNYIKKC